MDIGFSAIIAGLVLPLYPLLFVIHQRIGRYDEIVEEFRRLQNEHCQFREECHGSRT